jgi:biopolymer transport protein ExbB/biopolymer transport protein TolQ
MEGHFSIGPLEIWQSMGIIGKLVFLWLMGMSIHSFTIMVTRSLAYRKTRQQSREFVARAREALGANDLDATLEAARERPASHVGRIYEAAIGVARSHPQNHDDEMFDAMERAVERESAAISQDLKRGLPTLASIGATAPFVGLFGTVVGIMNAFFGMASTGQGGIAVVAGGVAEALVNTAVGIFVALPAVWAFNYFLGHIEGFNSEMRIAWSELKDHFLIPRSE